MVGGWGKSGECMEDSGFFFLSCVTALVDDGFHVGSMDNRTFDAYFSTQRAKCLAPNVHRFIAIYSKAPNDDTISKNMPTFSLEYDYM